MVEKVKELGMDSIALTDHGSMYGVIRFHNACVEQEVKPIIGCEVYVARGSRHEKEASKGANANHLVLLAKDQQGYENLMELVTLAHLEGFYYKPRVDMEILSKYSKGIVATSACLQGTIASLIVQNQEKEAKKKAQEFIDIFGKDFYLELQDHPAIKEQEIANKGLVKLSREMGIPIVATNDCHYINPDDAEAQDVLLAIQTQKTVNDPTRMTMLDSPDFYIRSPEEMKKAFKDYPDAIKNTVEIAEKCNLKIPLGQKIYPAYPLPKGETAEGYLRKITYKQVKYRYPKLTKEVKKRIEYELGLIIGLGYAEYFLIVQDFVNWAKKQEIRVGPGRGSAAGSIVSYILRITTIDPLEHKLPFERFLNPERESTPDIDLDFPDIRRDEVIEYVRKKYGEDHVAQIITFGTMESRMAIRDVARALGHPYASGDRLAKLIPATPGKKVKINDMIDQIPELKSAYETEEDSKKILDIAQKLTSVARHASVHAAGVVISDAPLTKYTPLQLDTKGKGITTQYDMYALDLNVDDNAIGLLKMDFLGLRNLTILEKARDFVKETRNIVIDISEIPIDDKKVYKMISAGDTTGVFQLESQGMRRVAQKLKPTLFSDISAMVALYRPGPMQFIDEFIMGKQNPRTIRYPHPDLEPVLAETYGIAVYQEQVMEIPQVMAGYTLGEGDILRRAIGKKKIELMKKEYKRFSERALKRGYEKATIENVWSLIEKFAGYGFNKSHSVCYAMIAYQTAWMKANYPVEFMAALLTAEANSGSTAKEIRVPMAIQECQKIGIIVLPPNINSSQTGFRIEKDKKSKGGLAIRFGFSAIKNVGEAAINEIIIERKKNGKFESLADFCNRTSTQKVNKKVIESLVKAGAFDEFGKRNAILQGIDKIRSVAEKNQKQKSSGQTSIFASSPNNDEAGKLSLGSIALPEVDEFPLEEMLGFEKELFGFFLTDHPIRRAILKFQQLTTHKLIEVEELESSTSVRLAGSIANIRTTFTKKNNQEMAFLSVEDDTGKIDVVVFPNLFQEAKIHLVQDTIILIEGKVDHRDDRVSLLADKIIPPDQAEKLSNTEELVINIPSGVSAQTFIRLNSLLKRNHGSHRCILAFPTGKKMDFNGGINYSPELEAQIKKILGIDTN